MKRFIAGEDRSQITLLPDCLDPLRTIQLTGWYGRSGGRGGPQDRWSQHQRGRADERYLTRNGAQ